MIFLAVLISISLLLLKSLFYFALFLSILMGCMHFFSLVLLKGHFCCVVNMNLSDSALSPHIAALRIGSFICTHSICDDLGQTSFHSPLPHWYSGTEGHYPLTSHPKSLAVWCLSHNNTDQWRLDHQSQLYNFWNLDYVNSKNILWSCGIYFYLSHKMSVKFITMSMCCCHISALLP